MQTILITTTNEQGITRRVKSDLDYAYIILSELEVYNENLDEQPIEIEQGGQFYRFERI